jgi:hypothetical protein
VHSLDMNNANKEDMNDVCADTTDSKNAAQRIVDALECAEGSEKKADLITNIDEALAEALELVKELKELKARAKVCTEE